MMNPTRRRLLRGIAIGTASLPFISGLAAAQRPPVFVRNGVNQIDGNGDSDTEVNVLASADPATGTGRVAHATAGDGTSDGDYVTTVKPLNVALGDIDSLTYEYYETPNNPAAPGEVWLYIRDPDGNYHTVWHAANDDKTTSVADGQWHTRNVHKEIRGNPDPEDNPNFYWFELTDSGRSGISNNDGDGNHTADLVKYFGADATLLRLGAAAGNFGDDVTVDVYFRNLMLNRKPRGNFPVNGGETRGRGR